MLSRYDFYKESVVLDPEDNICYPDPLLDYNHSTMSRIPPLYTINEQDIRKFWVCMWENYGMNYYDDLWLSANGISYLMELHPGDEIYKVPAEDLTGLFLNRQQGTE
jgi:hypothetical protein